VCCPSSQEDSGIGSFGWGGKGAYEIGVILALFDCGLRHFSALSGASVGALNAVLFHELCRTGDRDLVLRIWAHIHPNKVMKRSRLAWLPKLVAYAGISLVSIEEPRISTPIHSLIRSLDPERDPERHGMSEQISWLVRRALMLLAVLGLGTFCFGSFWLGLAWL
jgi:hypothetical protein